MLLERKVKVFRGKSFLAFGLLVTVFYASLGITALDPAGVTRYIPETEKIEYVTISTSHYVYDIRHTGLPLTDPADIETIRGIHSDCIQNPVKKSSYSHTPLYVRYELTNGTSVERYYYIPEESENTKIIAGYFSSVEAVFDGIAPEVILEKLRMLELYSYDLDMPLLAVAVDEDYLDLSFYEEKYGDTGECLAYQTDTPAQDDILVGLFEAIKADCGRGTIAQSGRVYDQEIYAHINLQYYMGNSSNYLDIEIFTDSENTIAYLKSLQPKKEDAFGQRSVRK